MGEHGDDGDEHDSAAHRRERTITQPELYPEHPTPPAKVPEGGDPWVNDPPRVIPVVGPSLERDPSTRFLSMSGKLLDASRLLLSMGVELQTGRVSWCEDMRREWGGRLRRMGVDIDTFLSATLP